MQGSLDVSGRQAGAGFSAVPCDSRGIWPPDDGRVCLPRLQNSPEPRASSAYQCRLTDPGRNGDAEARQCQSRFDAGKRQPKAVDEGNGSFFRAGQGSRTTNANVEGGG